MSTVDRDRAIAKIRKCLALSKSANEHEAAAALRQAQKLMAEHGLDELQVDMAQVSEHSTRVQSETLPVWEVRLADLVAGAFGCQQFVLRKLLVLNGRCGRRSEFVFVGVGVAPQLAQYAHEVLARQCARARRAHVAAQPKSCKPATKTSRGDAFALAWVRAVTPLVQRYAGSEQQEALIEAYMQRHRSEMQTVDASSRHLSKRVRDDSWRAGLAAGRKAQLHGAVSGGSAPLALGNGVTP